MHCVGFIVKWRPHSVTKIAESTFLSVSKITRQPRHDSPVKVFYLWSMTSLSLCLGVHMMTENQSRYMKKYWAASKSDTHKPNIYLFCWIKIITAPHEFRSKRNIFVIGSPLFFSARSMMKCFMRRMCDKMPSEFFILIKVQTISFNASHRRQFMGDAIH